MQQIIVDEYRPGDEERMAEIAPRAFSVFTRLALDYTLPRDKVAEAQREEALGYANRARAGEEGFAVFTARLNGLLIGYIAVGINRERTRRFGMKWGVIISLAVDPDYHHRGAGKALVARAVEWFKEQGCRYAEVSTDQNNIAAIRTYEGAGFRTIYSGVTLSQLLE